MIRDSRLKPLVETGTGSIGEADESGGGAANRPTIRGHPTMTIPNPTIDELIERAVRSAISRAVSAEVEPSLSHKLEYRRSERAEAAKDATTTILTALSTLLEQNREAINLLDSALEFFPGNRAIGEIVRARALLSGGGEG